MKKFSILILIAFGYFSNAVAIESAGYNLGVSLTGGVFEVDGGKETFSGDHVSGASATTVNKTTAGQDEAEGAFAIGSVFAEITFDKLALGLDYVPHSMDTETAENSQTGIAGTKTNTVQVDFEDLVTLYATLNLEHGIYIKAGMMQVDAITNETLGTGGAYGDVTLDGTILGIGYNRDLSDGRFVRVEANHMEFDGATLTNANDSTKSVTADGISGYGARISVGKSF